MSHQCIASVRVLVVMVAVVSLAPIPVAGQTQTAAGTWTVPRTPDGRPDLQGMWTNATITPLERPEELGEKRAYTAEEALELEGGAVGRIERAARPSDPNREQLPVRDDNQPGGYNNFWIDRGTLVATVAGEKRTSLIIEPPNGRIPPRTPEGQKRAAARSERRRQGAFDHPELRPLGERCLLAFGSSSGPPMLPVLYNNHDQIVQTPAYVMILVEMVHDARIIPLDGRPHPPPHIRKWMGDSVGHWEGDTLVVDTTNFTSRQSFRGSSENLHVIERFTRVDAGTILYEFTIDDPTTFTQTWGGEIPLFLTEEPLYEYACHEGNYALPGILAGARLLEKEAAEAEAR